MLQARLSGAGPGVVLGALEGAWPIAGAVLLFFLDRQRRLWGEGLAAMTVRHARLARYTETVVAVLSPAGLVLEIEPSVERTLGWPPAALLGVEAASLLHPDDRAPFAVAQAAALRGPDELSFTHRLRNRDGDYLWFDTRWQVGRDPATGTPTAIVIAATDVSRRRRAELLLEAATCRLESAARTDTLTGIANRRSFDEATSEALLRAMRGAKPVSVLMIDIDHLKHVNDARGHEAGDACLRAVATAVDLSARRPGDFACRYRGGRFALLLPDTDIAGAVLLAEQVRVAVSDLAFPIEAMPGPAPAADPGTANSGVPGNSVPGNIVTVSVGAACVVPGESGDRTSLLAAAERALDNARKAGRNAVRVAGSRAPDPSLRPSLSPTGPGPGSGPAALGVGG